MTRIKTSRPVTGTARFRFYEKSNFKNASGYAERAKAIQNEYERLEREKKQKDKRKSQLTADIHNS